MLVTDGLSKFVWFHTLNRSAENLTLCSSRTLQLLASDTSQFCWNGPRKTLRPSVPKPVEPSIPTTGAGTKASRFRYPESRCRMSPEVNALATVYPGARLGVAVFGKAVP